VKYFFNYTSSWHLSSYVFNNHDQEGELNGKGLLGVNGAGDVVGADVGAHNF